MLITRNYIKVNNESYMIVRSLNNNTTDEQAQQIHEDLNTDTLLRDNNGRWHCCLKVKDVEFRDISIDELMVMGEKSSINNDEQENKKEEYI